MSKGQESAFKVTSENGMILDTPKLVQDARILSKRSTINIIQILFSKIQDQEQVSWWSIGALRQKTLYNTVHLKEILRGLTQIGLVEQLKIKNIVSYSLAKRPFHGIIPINENRANRRRYVGDQYCYRIKADYIDLVFS